MEVQGILYPQASASGMDVHKFSNDEPRKDALYKGQGKSNPATLPIVKRSGPAQPPDA
jgi:hypothetical protein